MSDRDIKGQDPKQNRMREESQKDLERRLGRHPLTGVQAVSKASKKDAPMKVLTAVFSLIGGIELAVLAGMLIHPGRSSGILGAFLLLHGGVFFAVGVGLHLKIRKESAAWRPNIRDGRWYWAKITQVEKEEDRGHSNPRYILSCEAEGRKFVWTLAEPVQQSCMGGWAPVYASDSQPDLYVIDEKRMRLEYGEEGTRSPIYRITVRKKPENKKIHAKRSEKEAAARNEAEDRLFNDADAMIGDSEGKTGENE